VTVTVPGWVETKERSGAIAFVPASYGHDRRFVTREILALGGQGYTVLVTDRWCGAPAVLKGLWWERSHRDDPRRAEAPLKERNALLAQGLSAVRQATELYQQAPATIALLSEPSPLLREVGFPPAHRVLRRAAVRRGGRGATQNAE
jgi:hypothetical protein